MNKTGKFQVGNWEVDPDAGELRDSTRCVKLESRVMGLLTYLYSNRERVVGRDELVTEVWRKRYLTDHSISVAIAALRRALGDSAHSPRYIKTIYKKGYRLIAATSDVADVSVPWSRRRVSVPNYALAITALAVAALVSTALVLPGDSRELDMLPANQLSQSVVLTGNAETGYRLWVDILQADDVVIDDLQEDPRIAQALDLVADSPAVGVSETGKTSGGLIPASARSRD